METIGDYVMLFCVLGGMISLGFAIYYNFQAAKFRNPKYPFTRAFGSLTLLFEDYVYQGHEQEPQARHAKKRFNQSMLVFLLFFLVIPLTALLLGF